MWERFELFWSALEKFALFFSFVATLTLLVGVVLVYDQVTRIDLEPEPPPAVRSDHLDPIYDLVGETLRTIQDSKWITEVTIDRTIPVTFTVRMNPSQANLALVGRNTLNTGAVAINLRNGAGRLVGDSATLEVVGGTVVKVQMDLSQEVVINVPVQVTVPVEVSLDNVALGPVLEDLERARRELHREFLVSPAVVEASEP